jgi:diguanylate cyclase (GGDEF)-like protein/PAS domain S-box-containing protein
MRTVDAEPESACRVRLLEEAQAVAHVGSWDWNIASGRLSWSAEHYRIFGVDSSLFSPTIENGLAFIHEDDRDRVQAILATTVEVGQPYSYLCRIRRPSGEIRWIESVGVPSIVDGVVLSFVGTALDVTARETSQAALCESETRYKAIVETAQEAIWVVDFDGTTSFANEQLAAILGRTLDEIIGAPAEKFLGSDAIVKAGEIFARLQEGTKERFDFKFTRPDGTEAWAMVSLAPIQGADGEYGSVLVMLTDITERRHAELRLHASEARLAEAQRLTRLGSFAYDVKSRSLTCSDGLFLVIGVEPSQGIPSFDRFLLLVHPDDRGRAEAFLTGVQYEFTAPSDELRITTPGGEERWLAAIATPVVDTHGTVIEMSGTLQDITERKVAEQQLTHLALHDMLTELPNRSLFNDRLEHALARRDNPVAVMLLDLDGLKAINDGLGHSAGDALLVGVAQRLSRALRPSDTVARFGGDEFTILVEGAGETEAAAAAERLLRVLATPLVIEGRNVVAQASIGVALGTGGARHGDALLREADSAMYAAKRRGGGRYEFFDAELHATVVQRMTLECDLRTVELGAEMTLSYQPLVDLRDGQLTGFEALLRWNHPQRGAISPAEFIPIAEQTGAIVPIGRWVIEQACRQSRLWQQHHPAAAGLAMNVNVSARQLADPDIVRDVARGLDLSGLDPGLLTLEITETMIMADEDQAGEILQQLKDLGVRISVDDFGTGYSSLGHLDRRSWCRACNHPPRAKLAPGCRRRGDRAGGSTGAASRRELHPWPGLLLLATARRRLRGDAARRDVPARRGTRAGSLLITRTPPVAGE